MAVRPRPVALVLRALGLGDLLTAVPALRALRSAFAGHRLVLAAPSAYQPLVALADAADDILPAVGLEPLTWGDGAVDVAVNLHGRGPHSHRVLSALGPRRLIAFGCAAAGVSGPIWRVDEHEVDRWCRLVSESCGVGVDPTDLRIRRPALPAPVQGAVVVHPGAASASRRWPSSRFGEVAIWAARLGPVVITGSSAEKPLAKKMKRGMGSVGWQDFTGTTSLMQLAALVASARLVISGDTGVAHLATAFGTPSVTLFGPTPPQWWGPRAPGPHVVLWAGAAGGDPHGQVTDPALLALSSADVIAAAEHALQLDEHQPLTR